MLTFSGTDLQEAINNKLSFQINEKIDVEFDEFSVRDKVEGNLTFQLTGNFIIVSGSFKAPVTLLCGRCVKNYNSEISGEIDEVIEINNHPEYQLETELTMDSSHELVKIDEQIDVIDYLRQYVILNIPNKKVCSENCTNEDLNSLNSYHESKIDPRWDKLISYKDNYRGD